MRVLALILTVLAACGPKAPARQPDPEPFCCCIEQVGEGRVLPDKTTQTSCEEAHGLCSNPVSCGQAPPP